MKHTFLLDENILYHAIRGINEFNDDDLTALNLLRLILRNCHKIVYDSKLCSRYSQHMDNLKSISEFFIPGADLIIKSLLYQYLEKALPKFEEAPTIPEEKYLPSEDIHVGRAAVYCGAEIIITADKELRDAINEISFENIKALSPLEAIEYAKES